LVLIRSSRQLSVGNNLSIKRMKWLVKKRPLLDQTDGLAGAQLRVQMDPVVGAPMSLLQKY
jgi:hypothetical protein